MKIRTLLAILRERLNEAPAVALLGPRQVGKTTLALELARERDALYLDLESEADRGRLAQPELYLAGHLSRLVILDEVHRTPDLFPVLRGLIDRARREGHGAGRYLLLGSASLDLLSRAGESLAGRISYMELGPFTALETQADPDEPLWIRGGYPSSFLAASDAASLRWRQSFLRSYLEHEIPRFGSRLPAETLRRLWTMLAHQQGGLHNAATLARSLGMDVRTINSCLDLLVNLLLLRRLPAWHANTGKRLVKSPRLYWRDSGWVHALLGLGDRDAVLGHPVAGASWEGHVVENLLSAVPEGVQAYHFRTGGGAELDLLLVWPSGRKWAVEIKRSLAPRPTRGFHSSCADLQPEGRFIVYPGSEAYPLGEGVEVVSLVDLMRRLTRGGCGTEPGAEIQT